MLASKSRPVACCALLILLAAGSAYRLQADSSPAAPPAYPLETPRSRGLDSNLYMQTSAEYRACCYQAYNLAALRLRYFVDARKDRPRDKDAAVIMDLDETVFDNSGFQASQERSGLTYDKRLWGDWENNHSQHIGLIPGARRFIQDARRMNVTVFFVSNRSTKCFKQAKDALARLEIPITDDSELKLSSGIDDKSSRFDEVKQKYDVLLMVGDNLRDFKDSFKCPDLGKKTDEDLEKAIQVRREGVDHTESTWGDKWIILPNPSYGEWTRPLGLGERDYDRLVKQAPSN